MEAKTCKIKTIDDAIGIFKEETHLDLETKKFSFSFIYSNLRYKEEDSILDLKHRIKGCNFYKDGDYYGSLVIDIDPEFEMINSAAYRGKHPGDKFKDFVEMEISITKKRTENNPEANFARSDINKIKFLGVNPESQTMKHGLAVDFLPLYER